ncbi:uncharacterized protein LOC122386949 [Amphibalanus amphitrite]|uniref:uncharacterized protein LOC122386949 n=1 Tax=Amphibalanus amphitrite TaxID=1232801 RepID=UPI001C914E28|nr:uncharacterized protein LOC122386949 [Amphibalanus amphitrite]
MWLWRKLLLKFLVLACLSVAAGAAATILNGLLVYVRHHLAGSSRPRADYVTKKSVLLLVSIPAAVLLLTQTEMPWEWLGTLTLLVAIAPALLTWLGPPDEHVENCQLCQIGKGSAYNHYFGYLRLMEGEHGIRTRLEKFKRENPAGLPEEVLEKFKRENPAGLPEEVLEKFKRENPAGFPEEELEKLYSKAVVVLAPKDGSYPEQWDRLEGVGKITATLKPFKKRVGGNERSYGEFKVHEVKSSDGEHKMYVALDKVGALETLQKLRNHGPAGLSVADCRNQMKELIEELKVIVAKNDHLKGQLKVVSYDADEHVGDAILAAIEG